MVQVAAIEELATGGNREELTAALGVLFPSYHPAAMTVASLSDPAQVVSPADRAMVDEGLVTPLRLVENG